MAGLPPKPCSVIGDSNPVWELAILMADDQNYNLFISLINDGNMKPLRAFIQIVLPLFYNDLYLVLSEDNSETL